MTDESIFYSEGFARAALDSLSAQIAVLDAQGTILAVNKAWREFGAANGSACANSNEGANYLGVCDVASGTDSREANAVAEGIRAVAEKQTEIFALEYPCHSPDEQRWFSIRATRFPGDGPARVVVAHENITGRKLGEESLKQRVEELAAATGTLERMVQELDQFAYITSHDLKAPLRGIANLARWIEEDIGDALTPEVNEHLTLLRGRVTRMEAMIEGILQYARIGRAVIHPEPVSVGALLDEVADLLAPTPPFRIEIAPEMPTLTTERLPLQQVFLNLLSNAVKHNPKPDGCVRVSARSSGRFYEFSVSDDGPGIDPAYHDKVFVIFQTLEARDKMESTGVGLAVVKKIVERMGGTVKVESKEGAGATFRFTWPKTVSVGAVA